MSKECVVLVVSIPNSIVILNMFHVIFMKSIKHGTIHIYFWVLLWPCKEGFTTCLLVVH